MLQAAADVFLPSERPAFRRRSLGVDVEAVSGGNAVRVVRIASEIGVPHLRTADEGGCWLTAALCEVVNLKWFGR